ncbi:MAG: DUF2066 domain-containing protein [Rhodospirillaceae bacterium]|nr:DUF2066 domain-containing protein [Rhodospirillaceae bacterium]
MSANILDRRGFAMAVGCGLKPLLSLAFIGLFLAVSTPVLAQPAPAGPGPITVKDLFVAAAVPVDVTAANVTEARERGLTQGRVNGFRKVVERIVAREDLARVPQLSATQIIDIVREFSIANERSSAVRYLADLTVRFDGADIRGVLRNANIPFTETISKPLVVVPLMREGAGGRWMLWEQSNVWRDAWMKVPRDLGLVPLIALSGDSALTAEQASGKDLAALNALAARYGAGGTVLAMATVSGDTVQMSLVELRSDLPSEDIALSQSAEAGQSREDFLAVAARAAGMAVQDSWKRRNRVAFGGTTQITALVPVKDIKEWLTVKNRLDDVPLIDRLELQAMTRDRAQVTLYYAGAQRQLELAMSQHDLSLAQQNGVWIIQAR